MPVDSNTNNNIDNNNKKIINSLGGNLFGRFANLPSKTACIIEEVTGDNANLIMTPERKVCLEEAVSSALPSSDYSHKVTLVYDSLGEPVGGVTNTPTHTELKCVGKTNISYDSAKNKKAFRALFLEKDEQPTPSVTGNTIINSPLNLKKIPNPDSNKKIIGPVEVTKKNLNQPIKRESQNDTMGKNGATAVANHYGKAPHNKRCEWAHLLPKAYGFFDNINSNGHENLVCASREYNTEVTIYEDTAKEVITKNLADKINVTLEAKLFTDDNGEPIQVAEELNFKLEAKNIQFDTLFKPMNNIKKPTKARKGYLQEIVKAMINYPQTSSDNSLKIK